MRIQKNLRSDICVDKNPRQIAGDSYILVIFSLAGSFGFLFAANGWFLIMFALADFLLDAGFRAAALKSSERAVKRFILFYDNACHGPDLTSP